jgi:hypothetical protein
MANHAAELPKKLVPFLDGHPMLLVELSEQFV